MPAGGPQRVMAKVYAATPARRRLPFLAPQWAGLLAACAVAVVLWITLPPAATVVPETAESPDGTPMLFTASQEAAPTPCGLASDVAGIEPVKSRCAPPIRLCSCATSRQARRGAGVRPDVQPAGDGGLLVQFERLRQCDGVLVGLNDRRPGLGLQRLSCSPWSTRRPSGRCCLRSRRTAFSLNCTALALLEPV